MPVGIISKPNTGSDVDGSLELFVSGHDDQLWNMAQEQPNGDWGACLKTIGDVQLANNIQG